MKHMVVPIVLLLFAGQISGQTPITLEEALQLAGRNNLQIKKQEQKEKMADLEVAIRRGQRLPSLEVAATSTYFSEIAKFDLPRNLTGGRLVQIELGGRDRTEFSVGLRQPIFNGGRLRTQTELAESAAQSEQTRQALLKQQIAYQAYLLFYRAQSLQRERQIQQASWQRLSAQLKQARHLFEAAQVMAYDTLRVFNQRLQVKIQLDQNERDQRLLELQLAQLLDLPQPRPVAREELDRPSEFVLSLDSLLHVAKLRRPELAGVRLRQRVAQLNRRLARSPYFPSINAEARYEYAKPGLNQVANQWMDYAFVGVNVQWNLWRWQQDRHRVQQATLEHSRLTLEERELLRRIEYEVEQGWENVKFSVKQIELAERLLAQQQERYRIASAQQRLGVATTNDVVVAEADLTGAELQLQRALIQYAIAQGELRLATAAFGDESEPKRPRKLDRTHVVSAIGMRTKSVTSRYSCEVVMNNLARILFVLALALPVSCSDRDTATFHASAIVEGTAIQVSAQTGGYLEAVYLDEGDQVEIGQTLALVDTEKIAYQLEQVQASREELAVQRQIAETRLQRAQQDYNYAKTKYERYQDLFRKNAASEQVLDDLRNVFERAGTALESARQSLASIASKEKGLNAQFKLLRRQIRDALVTAPVSGTITTRYYEPGETIPPNAPVVEIINLAKMSAKVYVSETYLPVIKVGQPAEVEIDGTGQTLTGTVAWISPKAEFTPKSILTEESRTALVYAVKINIDNPDGILKHGMPVAITLHPDNP